jgi:hypothetical protein
VPPQCVNLDSFLDYGRMGEEGAANGSGGIIHARASMPRVAVRTRMRRITTNSGIGCCLLFGGGVCTWMIEER